MPLTDEELRNNYWLAVVVYLCDYGATPYTKTDPSTAEDWSFSLADDGTPPHPNPQISAWGVDEKPQPTSEQLMETVDMSMIDAAFAEIYGEAAVKEKKDRQTRERRQLSLREAKLAREAAARLEAERAEAARLEAEQAEAARLEAEQAEAARLEAEQAEAARAEEARAGEARLEAERAGGSRPGPAEAAAGLAEEPVEIKIFAAPAPDPPARRGPNLAPHPKDDPASDLDDAMDSMDAMGGGGILEEWSVVNE